MQGRGGEVKQGRSWVSRSCGPTEGLGFSSGVNQEERISRTGWAWRGAGGVNGRVDISGLQIDRRSRNANDGV